MSPTQATDKWILSLLHARSLSLHTGYIAHTLTHHDHHHINRALTVGVNAVKYLFDLVKCWPTSRTERPAAVNQFLIVRGTGAVLFAEVREFGPILGISKQLFLHKKDVI